MVSFPQNLTKLLVCIDAYRNADIQGRLISAFELHSVAFTGAWDLIKKMDGLFNRLSYPQAYFKFRHFGGCVQDLPQGEALQVHHAENLYEMYRGMYASFNFQILTRQNTTWQGVVQRLETGETVPFSSVLSMVKLICEVLPDWGYLRWDTATSDPQKTHCHQDLTHVISCNI